MAYYDVNPPHHSETDLRDYYDDNLPPPHRLSSLGFNHPSAHNSTQDIPLTSANAMHAPPDANTRGAYAAPIAAASHVPDRDYTYAGNVNSEHLEKFEIKRGRRKQWMIIGGIIGVIALIAIMAGVVVAVTKHKSTASSKLSSSSNSSGIVNQTNPNDPSTFVKDSRLIQSFYGLAYTPEGSQLPDCGNSLADVITDIQLMSQLTTRIRLYGADCNQSALVLEAIKQTKVNMTVYLANYPIATDNNTAYNRQRDLIQGALQTYGADNVGGVTVGNEFILNYVTNAGASDPNSAAGNEGAAILIADIQDTRNMIGNLTLSKTLQVGTSDAGSYFNNLVLEAVDYGMANVHPWFANQTIDYAANWTADFFANTDIAAAAAVSNTPKMYIAETGWPSDSKDVGNESDGPSTATEANLQIFLNDFVCQANTNGTGYFFFEYFDEPWKDVQFGGVEGHWGLFYSNRTMKSLTIPNCPIS